MITDTAPSLQGGSKSSQDAPLFVRVGVVALVAFVAFSIPAAFLLRRGLTGDVWWVWKAGQWMALHHRVLGTNPRSWNGSALAGKPWINLEWGWERFLYLANPHLAAWRFIALACGCSLAILITFYWAAKGVAPSLKSEWILCLYLIYSTLFLIVTFKLRAEMFSYIAFPLLLGLLWRGRQNMRWLWGIVPLTVLWANVHGSWLMVPALVGLEILGAGCQRAWSRTIRLTLIGAITFGLVIILTPWHWQTFTYALWLDQNAEIQNHIAEWLSPNFHETWLSGLAAFALAAALWRTRTRIAYPWLLDLWMAGVTWMFLDSVRMLPYWGLVLMLWVAYGLGSYPRLHDVTSAPYSVRSLWGGILAAWVAALVVLSSTVTAGFLSTAVPSSIIHWLNHHAHAVIFNPYAEGGALIGQNVHDVYIDGRTDFYLYNGDRFQTYVQTINGRVQPHHLAAAFRHQNVRMIVWPIHTIPPLLVMFTRQQHWAPVYQADGWAVYAPTPKQGTRPLR